MKLYYPKSHYHKSRQLVFPLLRPFIKNKGYTDAERIELYGLSEKDFEFTDILKDADVAILTMAWNYYVKTKQTDLAINFIKECNALGKKVLAVNTEDFGVRIPYFENLIVLRYSGYKSKFSKSEYVQPPFIKDPLLTYFDRETIIERPYTTKAVIGFCGQANPSSINAAKEVLIITYRNLKFYVGLSPNEPQQLKSSTFLRASVLKDIQKSKAVVSNFILRKKYRAGVTKNKDTHQTTLEFYDNLKDSDYVVCVRGAGNFSIRFYEALAMGRIPVFINTDCALPFDEELDWKKHVVWVEFEDRHKVAKKVVEFHKALTEREFADLQYANRKLWEERLTLDGFFKNLLQEKYIGSL
ncbi:MAG: exostosin domain-containing protein [Aequorivita sp.]